ncbi:hypothetical protein [Parasitella parasitica]|uniref:Core-binding (CB) domain-containing protein n=1 Tax=Parasitella parasitica TaxID=35722 RepID=A0A0B7MVI8_9FUNG|nr:hypothetical protein [Parasitella parasitica]
MVVVRKCGCGTLYTSKVDSLQLTNLIYKFTETTRAQARAATQIYELLNFLQSRGLQPADEPRITNEIESIRNLAVFGFGAAKLQESEARDTTLKAIKLPPTLKHLEPHQSCGDKKYALSEEFLERLCSIPKSPAPAVLESSTRSICSEDRCTPTEMAEKRLVHESTMAPDPTSIPEIDKRSNPGDSILDNTVLVSNADEHEATGSSGRMVNGPLGLHRLALVSKKRKDLGMPEDLISHLNKATGDSTTRMYNASWKKYVDWCTAKHRDPTADNAKQIFNRDVYKVPHPHYQFLQALLILVCYAYYYMFVSDTTNQYNIF